MAARNLVSKQLDQQQCLICNTSTEPEYQQLIHEATAGIGSESDGCARALIDLLRYRDSKQMTGLRRNSSCDSSSGRGNQPWEDWPHYYQQQLNTAGFCHPCRTELTNVQLLFQQLVDLHEKLDKCQQGAGKQIRDSMKFGSGSGRSVASLNRHRKWLIKGLDLKSSEEKDRQCQNRKRKPKSPKTRKTDNTNREGSLKITPGPMKRTNDLSLPKCSVRLQRLDNQFRAEDMIIQLDLDPDSIKQEIDDLIPDYESVDCDIPPAFSDLQDSLGDPADNRDSQDVPDCKQPKLSCSNPKPNEKPQHPRSPRLAPGDIRLNRNRANLNCQYPGCEFVACRRSQLGYHAQETHPESLDGLHVCKYCGACIPTKKELDEHVATHLADMEPKFPCKFCPKKYLSYSGVLKHHYEQHSEEAVPSHYSQFRHIAFRYRYKYPDRRKKKAQLPTQAGTVGCQTSKNAIAGRAPKIQAKTTTGESVDLVCPVCSKEHTDPVKLKNHIIRHKKRNKCTVAGCGAAYAEATKLRYHQIAVHPELNLPKFKCSQCEYETHRPSSLRHHIARNHDTSLLHHCPHEGCNFAAAKGSGLKEHIARRHEKTGTFPCAECGVRFPLKIQLKKHLTQHGNPDADNSNSYADPTLSYCHHKGCTYSCPRSRPYRLKHHILEVHDRAEKA